MPLFGVVSEFSFLFCKCLPLTLLRVLQSIDFFLKTHLLIFVKRCWQFFANASYDSFDESWHFFCKCLFWLSCNLRWGRITPGCGRFSPNTRTAGCLQFVAFLCKLCVKKTGSFSLPSWHFCFISRPRTVLVVAVPHGEKADLDQVRRDCPILNIINHIAI